MGDKGMERKKMNENEYNRILNTIYDRHNILNFIEDELILFGVYVTTSSYFTYKAEKNQHVYNTLSEFMKETDKTKRSSIIQELKDRLEYDPSKNRS